MNSLIREFQIGRKVLAFVIATSIYTIDATAQSGVTQVTVPPREAAQSEMRPHVGLIAGSTIRDSSAHGTLGIDAGMQPYIPFGLGVEFLRSQVQSPVDDQFEDAYSLMGRGTYNFGGEIPFIRHSYIGLMAGAINTAGETLAASAPVIGFDIPLKESSDISGNYLSLGANARYTIIEGSGRDNGLLAAQMKYWF